MIEIKPDTKCAECGHEHRDHLVGHGCGRIVRRSFGICGCAKFEVVQINRPDAVREIANAVLLDIMDRADIETLTPFIRRVQALPASARESVYEAVSRHTNEINAADLNAAFARLEQDQ
jgi:hypothetical protein